ncbi:MAG: dihydropteroate synthase [Planctomycetota bacterium]|jgi:dihydropteroate synthase
MPQWTSVTPDVPAGQNPHGRVTHWRLATVSLPLGPRPAVMGILNVTPDSFSDGGRFFTIQSAVDRAKEMEDAGARIIDIGGESTRPYSQTVAADEELQRVVPVLERLQGKLSIPISIDTTKSAVARAAMELGAEIINDVSGLEADPEMVEIARSTGAGVCAMHRLGPSQSMQDDPQYENCVVEIVEYLRARDRFLLEAGIAPERICLDPGIGFGKTHEHNLELIRNAGVFHLLRRPILVGHSRKGFIAKALGSKDIDRKYGTLGVSLALCAQGIQILRVHDVAAHVQAIQLFVESRG